MAPPCESVSTEVPIDYFTCYAFQAGGASGSPRIRPVMHRESRATRRHRTRNASAVRFVHLPLWNALGTFDVNEGDWHRAAVLGSSLGIMQQGTEPQQTMQPPSLQVNDLIQIRILEGEVRDSYPSRVEDLVGDDIVVAWPTERGTPLPVSAGQTVRVSFVHDGKYYGFDGTVRETASAPLPVLVLHVPVGPDRIERRDNVRVNAPVQVELTEKVVSLSEYKALGEHNVIRAVTDNISGGGFAIHHGTYIPVGTIFDVKMILADNEDPIPIVAKVARCVESPGGGQYHIGFAYSQVSEKIRSRIVRFVFAAQISEKRPRLSDQAQNPVTSE
jgi:c-di-GMP-binding flagellar brake protein YcgR